MTKRKKSSKKRLSGIQKTILAIIVSLSVLIIGLVISSIFLNPEAITKRKISALASEYYENYLYENLKNSDQVPDFEKAIEGYKDYGFAHVYLRQLIYYDNNEETIRFLKKYCDENKTAAKIYPEPPYTKKSYRIDYTYSCDFKQNVTQ